jgi:hypothetical protein
MTTLAATDDATFPTMGPVRRTRHAFRIAWTALRTGKHETAEAFMNGVSLGMDTGTRIATDAFTERFGRGGTKLSGSPR